MGMKREKQYNMFDVATGACTLGDYLFQRYSENDLTSTFWIDEKDEVDELLPPKPLPDGQPGTEPVVIPIQGPRAQKKTKLPPPPTGLEEAKPAALPETAGTETQETNLPESLAEKPNVPQLDGSDTFQKTEQNTPSLETFQAGVAGEKQKSPSPDAVTLSEEEPDRSNLPGPIAKAPSMEDLLKRFHEATRDYKERNPEGVSGEDDSESSQDEPS